MRPGKRVRKIKAKPANDDREARAQLQSALVFTKTTGQSRSDLTWLISDLAVIFQNAKGDPTALRKAYATSIFLIANFLAGLGRFTKVATEPLVNLSTWLEDLSDGNVHPVLQAPTISNRSRDPRKIWCGRSWVVLGWECCRAGGLTNPEIFLLIESHFSQCSHFLQRNKTLRNSVVSWRRSIINQTAPDYAVEGYRVVMDGRFKTATDKVGLGLQCFREAVHFAENSPWKNGVLSPDS